MDIQSAIEQYAPLPSLLTTAEIDAEIREELEFHLHMRTQDNLREGMTPEEAESDAQERFGDFEANRRACRKIALGPRLLFHKLQTLVIAVLLGAVVYQAVLLFQLQSSSRDEIESLTQLVEELRGSQETVDPQAATTQAQSKNDPLRNATVEELELPTGWDAKDDPLRNPWSDWGALDIQTSYD